MEAQLGLTSRLMSTEPRLEAKQQLRLLVHQPHLPSALPKTRYEATGPRRRAFLKSLRRDQLDCGIDLFK